MPEETISINTTIDELVESLLRFGYPIDYAAENYCISNDYLQPEIKHHESCLKASKCVSTFQQKEISFIPPDGFYLLAQNRISNLLQKKLTERLIDRTQLDLLKNRTIEASDFKLFIRGYSELMNGIKASAAMLLDCLLIVATRNRLRDTLVILPLREYMHMRKLKDEKATREQVKNDMDALERVSFEYKGTGKQYGKWLKVHISGGTSGQIKNGDIIFRFNEDFFNSFKNFGNEYSFMYLPYETLQGNIKQHPYTYWLARKISEHKRMNSGKHNENIIKVKTLIEACPDYPTYDNVMKGNRNITKRIIEPFERDMDALDEALVWQYSVEDPKSYEEFISATVIIQWKNYPDIAKLKKSKARWIKNLKTLKKQKSHPRHEVLKKGKTRG